MENKYCPKDCLNTSNFLGAPTCKTMAVEGDTAHIEFIVLRVGKRGGVFRRPDCPLLKEANHE